jgi:SAM-dependent methyltransferase
MTDRHPGRGRSHPRDPDLFAALMRHPSFPRASRYDPAWVFANMMGPNPLWLAEDLARRMEIAPGARLLDLGCGKALTSIFLAREYGAEVWAADLWIDPTENAARALEAGLGTSVFPLRAEARRLPFAQGFFDAVISVDAYHYFGTDVRYLSYLAQFVRPGGRIGMASPANEADPDAPGAPAPSPELFEALGADWLTFRSAAWWERSWSRTRGVTVEHAEMVEDGWSLFRRSLEAAEAWSGVPVAEQPDAAMLHAPEGRSLGFCRIVARRDEARPLEFGPGGYACRIA